MASNNIADARFKINRYALLSDSIAFGRKGILFFRPYKGLGIFFPLNYRTTQKKAVSPTTLPDSKH